MSGDIKMPGFSEKILWRPPQDAWNGQMGSFIRAAEKEFGLELPDYQSAHGWSVTEDTDFWSFLGKYFRVQADWGVQVRSSDKMPHTEWFADTKINYAENALRNARGKNALRKAVIDIYEDGTEKSLTWEGLEQKVLAFAHVLKTLGVQKGDRVAASLPNASEALISMLASASIGAVWSVSSPDLSVGATLIRMKQLEPKILISSLGYSFNGKWFDRKEHTRALENGLPTAQHTIEVGDEGAGLNFSKLLDDAVSQGKSVDYERVEFGHPLWVLFTSGTTGEPKGIVHGHGGQTLEAVKLFGLHFEATPDDLYYSAANTSWMMWNTLLHALVAGAAVVTYSGSSVYPELSGQLSVLARTEATIFSTGAAYLKLLQDAGEKPKTRHDLTRLKSIMTTGSTLAPSTALWIKNSLSETARLSDASGGTDVCSAFVGGNPLEPVRLGLMQGALLGAPVDSFDKGGNPVRDEVGELVLTGPMPAMPIYFWDDHAGEKYRAAYFEDFPGVWTHGDWVQLNSDGTCMVLGRSDATLNRSGVRLGSSEVYSSLTGARELRDFLVLGIEHENGDYYMPLFVVLNNGFQLDENLKNKINSRIRAGASARHVPDDIIAAPDIPVTHSGKRLEIPLKKLYSGFPAESIDRGSVANPGSLDWFIEHSKFFIGEHFRKNSGREFEASERS